MKHLPVILKSVQAVAYTVGASLIIYNLSAIKVDKFGYFFKDSNQLWLAIGVGIVTVGLTIKNWNKL